MVCGRSVALLLALVVVAAACGGGDTATTADPVPTSGNVTTIANQGGDMEGHTPTGFAGSGTGLFVGDNLNSNFPDGMGVQTFLTFELPDDLTIDSAILRSDALNVLGLPFEDLGDLLVEPIEYEAFGPELFDLSVAGEPVTCRVGESSVECDVTGLVQQALEQGRDAAQFRLRFDRAADNDQQPDLALFYLTDSNTNESGIFGLVVGSGE